MGESPEMAADSQILPKDVSAEEYSNRLSLLDLAEVLDQHKIWVESGGESGVKADLCGANLGKADLTGVNLQGAHLHKTNFRGADLSLANLRGASLVQADLRDTNLLGTELRGANLMGAMVYGAEGLWVGRLGGTNLFDALLPESISAINSSKSIAQTTRVARWFYFLMFSISAICCVLIAFTNDLRLILDSSAVPLPRYGTILPMSGFYLGGPILLMVLYLRFHFLLLRLWGGIAALPAVFPDVPDGFSEAPDEVGARQPLAAIDIGSRAREFAGLLGGSCDAVFLLAALPGAARRPRDAAARCTGHRVGGSGNLPSADRFARSASR